MYYLVLPQWCHMASWNLVNIGSGNGLLFYSTKPLAESMFHMQLSIRPKLCENEIFQIFFPSWCGPQFFLALSEGSWVYLGILYINNLDQEL